MADWEGGRVDDVCWVNDPVPVPVPLLVVLLPLLSRERGPRKEKRRAGPTLEVEALAPTPVLNRTFSTTSTGRESSSLELSFASSCSSVMRLSRVDGRANSDIECAGGIWRVTEDSGMPVYGEDDRGGGKGEGLGARDGVLQLVLVRRVTGPWNHTRCWLIREHGRGNRRKIDLRSGLGGTYRGEVRAWWAVGIGEKFVVRRRNCEGILRSGIRRERNKKRTLRQANNGRKRGMHDSRVMCTTRSDGR